jgi:mono/diheme cytochrome c family protein
MSNPNPHDEPAHHPSADDALQPQAPEFIETPEVAPLSPEREHFPTWLYLICGIALFFAGSSFTGLQIFGQGLLDQGAGGPVPTASAASASAAPATPLDIGKKLYAGNCANCHQGTGEGQPGQYPSLVGSEWVLGNKKRLSAIMLAGLSGAVTVKGSTYSTQAMPGWAGVFTDEKLADIMTYIRATWGNTANAVTSDEVAAARTQFTPHLTAPYCEADLLGIAPHGPDPSDKK